MKTREEVSDLNKGRLSRNFLLTVIICQMSLLFRDTHTKNENLNFQKTFKSQRMVLPCYCKRLIELDVRLVVH